MLGDIGLGEVLLIAVLALLVFGPDRLPKVAADAARTLRQIREMASAARRELSDAAGLKDDELAGAVRDLRDLDPRRALLGTDPARPAASSSVAGAGPASATGPAGGAGPTGPTDTSPTNRSPTVGLAGGAAEAAHALSDAGSSRGGGPTSSGNGDSPVAGGAGISVSDATPPAGPSRRSAPQARPVVEPVTADPDWT